MVRDGNAGEKVMKSRMKSLAFLMPVFLLAGASFAQESPLSSSEEAELQQTRALLKGAREDILNEEMRFTEEEEAAFWPVYERYQTSLQSVRDRFAVVLVRYTRAYRAGTVTEQHANEFVEDYLDIQSEVLDIKKDYLDDFRDALSARKAARFYQLDNKIETELEYQLSQVIPLIDPV
jgi:hypothetical protein